MAPSLLSPGISAFTRVFDALEGGREPRQRMLEQRQQTDRRQSPDGGCGGQPGKQARRRVGEPVAAGIVGRDVPARQRRQDAAGEHAVGRDQRGGLVGVVEHLAQRDRDRQRFLFGIAGLDAGKPLQGRLRMGRKAALGGARAPQVGGGCRAEGFRRQLLAAAAGRMRQRHDRVAPDAQTRQQGLQGELRMAGERGCGSPPQSSPPP